MATITPEQQKRKDMVTKYILPNIMDLDKQRPRFLKPSYFLENLTPYVSVRIQVIGGGSEIDLIELSPPSMSLSKENPSAYNANIKHFSFNPIKSKSTIIFTDVDVMAMEVLGALVNEVQNQSSEIMLEVEYGWSYPQENKSVSSIIGNTNDDGIEARCFFRRTVFMTLDNLEMEYNSGSTDIILTCSKETTFPEPFNNFLPYDFLGRYPAITLQMIHTLFVVAIFMKEMTGNPIINPVKKGTYKINEEYKKLLHFLYFEKDIKDSETIIKLINKIYHFYRRDLLKYITDLSPLIVATKSYITSLNKNEKNLMKNPSLYEPKEKDNNFISIQKMVSSLVGTKESLTKDRVGQVNIKRLFDEVYKVKAPTTGTQKTTQIDNKGVIVKDDEDSIFGGSLFDIHENLRRVIKEKDKQGVEPFNDPLRDLVVELQSCLSDSYIHPWDVFKFCRDAFSVQLEAFKGTNVPSFSEARNVEISNSKYLQIFNFNQDESEILGYKVVNKGKESFYTNSDKTGFVSAKSITINPTTAWDATFKNIAEQVFLKVAPETYTQITNNTDAETLKKEKKNIVLPLRNTFSLLYKKEAIEKLTVYKTLIQARAGVVGSSQEKEIDKRINEVKSLNNMSPIFVNYLDLNESAGQIFGQQTGKNAIIQAYSYRTGGALQLVDGDVAGRFNPGYPSVMDINFPDARNLNIKFNYKNALDGIKAVMREKIPKSTVADKNYKEATTKLATAEETAKSKLSKKTLETKAQSAIEKTEEETTKENNAIQYQQYNSKLPYTHPSSLLFKKNIRSGSTYIQTLQERKMMQEYRKHLMLDVSIVTATLTILGDPVFDQATDSQFIFLKILNPDGSLSFFTGLYRITDVNHEITAGMFQTTLELAKDQSKSEYTNKAMYSMMTQMDNIKK